MFLVPNLHFLIFYFFSFVQQLIKGRHALVYDISTPNETWEWVNLKEVITIITAILVNEKACQLLHYQ